MQNPNLKIVALKKETREWIRINWHFNDSIKKELIFTGINGHVILNC